VVRGTPPVPLPEISEGILHAVLEIEQPGENKSLPFTNAQAKLTLRNVSEDGFVGLIDPFLWMIYQHEHQPIRWRIRNIDRPADKIPTAIGISRRLPLTSDFVILPPQGVAACRIGILPNRRGRYEVSVDLSGGIVAEQDKVQILKTGDPFMSFRLGGADAHVLRNDSITKCPFTVK
jgi:hypothetical protein